MLFSHSARRKTQPPKLPRLEQPWASWLRGHGYFRRGIFGGSVLQLYRTSYAVRSAFIATTRLLVFCVTAGPVICDAWLSLDYTVSNASVANLLLISFDRYMCVTRPLKYRVRRTPQCAVVMIVLAWVISALLWTPWIVAWPFIEVCVITDGLSTLVPETGYFVSGNR